MSGTSRPVLETSAAMVLMGGINSVVLTMSQSEMSLLLLLEIIVKHSKNKR